MSSKPFDVTRKYVRVTAQRDNGMVEFEFAVGEPELFVELIMPAPAFHAFCANNDVVFLEGSPSSDGTPADFAWRLHDATHQRFR